MPTCWPLDGRCACPGSHEGHNIGKAPIGQLAPHGVDDATTDAATVSRWWSQYPLANVSVALAPAGLLMVDPDSGMARADAHKRGLGLSIVRRSRNDAYLFTAPDGCPAARVIHDGPSGALDVLSDGYAIVHGTHASGAAIELDEAHPLGTAPAWAVEMVTRKATEKDDRALRTAERATGATAGGTEPPVRLHPRGLQRWRGELVQTTGGRTDTSDSLFFLGLDLAECNATHSAIVAALAERDVALGWRKYTDRADADERYDEIADKAIAREDAQRQGSPSDMLTWPTLAVDASVAGPANGECSPHCARHVGEMRRWRAETAALFRNPDLSAAEKLAHWALVNEFVWNGEPHTIRVKEFARRTGSSDRAVGRAIDRLSNPDDSGAPFRKTVTRVRLDKPLVNPVTGELVEWVSAIELAPTPRAAPDLLHAGATFSPQDKPAWGGAGRQRPACAKHPEAAVLATTALECSVCHEPIGSPETVVRRPQDALNVHLVHSDAQRPPPLSMCRRTPDVHLVHSEPAPPTPEADCGFDEPTDGTRSPWELAFLTHGSIVRWRAHVLGELRIRQGRKAWEAFAQECPDRLPRVVDELRRLRDASAGMVL